MKISVVTPTWRRRRFALNTIQQVRHQRRAGFDVEHLVVSDGPDPLLHAICDQYGAHYHELAAGPHHDFGAAARDAGNALAAGDYIAWWDDDNYYEPDYLQTLADVLAVGTFDVAVCQVMHWEPAGARIIPGRWTGEPRLNWIDTACIVARADLARRERWVDGTPTINDFEYFTRLWRHTPRVAWLDRVLADHLLTQFDP